jgi:hypothetical protein
MLTWFQVWPILGMPFFCISLISAIPTFPFFGRCFGGGMIREWLLNVLLLPVLPARFEDHLLDWFTQATPLQEWLLVALVAINLNAVVLPVLYGVAKACIAISGWYTRTTLSLKTNTLRR